MPARYFTPEQANAALEQVRPLAEQLVAHRRALAEAEARRSALLARIAGNGGGIQPSELARLVEAVEREATAMGDCVARIRAHGAEVKDAERGLIDFPALREGVEICLCWHVGEERIAYWHGLEEGYAGRKPLPL